MYVWNFDPYLTRLSPEKTSLFYAYCMKAEWDDFIAYKVIRAENPGDLNVPQASIPYKIHTERGRGDSFSYPRAECWTLNFVPLQYTASKLKERERMCYCVLMLSQISFTTRWSITRNWNDDRHCISQTTAIVNIIVSVSHSVDQPSLSVEIQFAVLNKHWK